jgi:uncharacterized protein (TIGR00725 family)
MNHKPKNGNPESAALQYKICISGAAETGHCAPDALQKAEALGRLIAERGMVAVTGATTGAPYWAAKGAYEAGGTVIGISPAASKVHHVKSYRLPADFHNLIIYTGFGYAGRDLLLVRSADAVVTVCGRIGTLNEFTSAFEDGKPIGILTSTGGTADMIADITAKLHASGGKIVYDDDPGRLLEKVTELIKVEEKELG